VQTEKQKEMLRINFGRDSIVMPMPCPGPSYEDYDGLEKERDSSSRVLWLGRICEVKRPDRLLELAKACPDVHFDFVGPMADSEFARDICEQAERMPNVTFHGPAERDEVSQFYKKAKILCCTSDFEGFPNTFLEAWSYGLPIVSTVDPDNLIADRNMGVVAHDVQELAAGIQTLLGESHRWQRVSETARRYYLENHTIEKVMEKFEGIFCEITDESDNEKKGENL
jgi:glycosyltransferase involved in cell wall biosynthesis